LGLLSNKLKRDKGNVNLVQKTDKIIVSELQQILNVPVIDPKTIIAVAE
jgi:hypothetical protein